MKAVIFDIDGTLVDSVDLHAHAWAATFEKYGKTIDVTAVRRQIGKGSDQLLPVFFSHTELQKFGEEMEKYRGALFQRNYLPRVTGFPKTRELFERIIQEGTHIALASSAKEEEIETYKKLARIEDLIESETSTDDVEKSKPQASCTCAPLAYSLAGGRQKNYAKRAAWRFTVIRLICWHATTSLRWRKRPRRVPRGCDARRSYKERTTLSTGMVNWVRSLNSSRLR